MQVERGPFLAIALVISVVLSSLVVRYVHGPTANRDAAAERAKPRVELERAADTRALAREHRSCPGVPCQCIDDPFADGCH